MILSIMISPTTTCTNRMKLTIFHGLTFRTIAEGFYKDQRYVVLTVYTGKLLNYFI